MFKVLQILSVFAFAVLISAVTSEECLSKTQTWGLVDNPYVFCYCDPTTNQAETVECEVGKGYVNNGTAVGCIPWMDWNDNCVNKADISKITCEGNYLQQPIASSNPGEFYMCPSAGVAPVALSCGTGKGFYDGNGYMGCFPFAMWREITGCKNTV